MSGNPFRRTKGDRIPESDGFGVGDGGMPSNIANASSRSKKKKVVKIQSPPHSPEDVPRRLSAGRISPPPPRRTFEDDVEESDSTATADSDLEQALRNTRRNSGSMEASPVMPMGRRGTGAPFNPFARTLATNEAAFGLQRAEGAGDGAEGRDGEVQERGGNTGRPAMDVDQFKNILLTGSADPSGSSSTASHHTPRFQDSSSNTTASSASTFEPYLDVQQDTPRTSFDQLDYPSDSSDGGDEERSGLMTGSERLDDFAPPAPPKHTHGQPYARKGPQTVSFADFDETITQGSRSTNPATATNGASSLRPPALHRSTSDLNKPLPLPPQEPAISRTALPEEPDVTPPTPSQDAAPSPTTEETPESKKPPPPPVSRRAGQHTSAQTRPATTATASPSAPQLESLSTSRRPSDEPSPQPAAAPPPPPPPSRKAKAPASSTLEPPSPTPSTVTPSSTSTDSKPIPPPPPRRMASKAGNSVKRTPSTASSRSSTQKREASGGGNSSVPIAAPVPPPPRRGVGAKRESVEVSSVSSVSQVENGLVASAVASTGGDETRDVLADLTAFQAEIDALRARAERPG